MENKKQETLKNSSLVLSEFLQNPIPPNIKVLRGGKLKAYLEPIEKKPLSHLQKSVLVGTLLGDATLQYNGGTSPHYKFDQKASNLDYVNVVYSVFEELVGTPPSLRLTNGGVTPHSWWFRTFRCRRFNFFANQFYEIDVQGNRRKVVPKNIHRWLNPIVLAFWFMDDGGTAESGYKLHTENFSLSDVKVLQQALGSVFQLQANIGRDNREQKTLYYLYIPANSKEKFQEIVKPHMVETMLYKLRLIDNSDSVL